MKNLKKDLLVVNRELMALSKKIDKIRAAVDTFEKSKGVEAKPVKKAAAKKTGNLSAADAVLAVIRRSRKGVDTAALKEKTGFQGQKLHNAVFALKKQGKIKSEKRGSYVKA